MSVNVAIVGATGAVGVEFMQVLERRGFPIGKLALLASMRGAGIHDGVQGRTACGAGADG